MSTISITRTTTAYFTLITSSDNMTASTTESAFRELEQRAEARIEAYFASYYLIDKNSPIS